MKRPPLRILDLPGGPEQRGAVHGSTHAEGIRTYLDERMHLVMSGLWSGGPMEAGAILELAESMLPAHEAHNPGLFVEMTAMVAAKLVKEIAGAMLNRRP